MSIAAALVLAASFPATAGSLTDLGAIDRAVAGFTGAAIGAPGGASSAVDRRLRLQPCGAALALAWRTQRRDTVVVRCPDVGGWTLYVPAAAVPEGPTEPPAIIRGDPVSIAVTGDGFTVAEPGEALESGGAGAWIKVRVAGARPAPDAALRAQVVRPGLVAVALP